MDYLVDLFIVMLMAPVVVLVWLVVLICYKLYKRDFHD